MELPTVIQTIKELGIDGAGFTLVKKVLGPALDEAGAYLSDYVRTHRFERQIKQFEKASRMLIDAKIKPQSVPLKLLLPLLDGASLEVDEDLSTMWAALLANGASPRHAEDVQPSFADILKQLTPRQGKILEFMAANYSIERFSSLKQFDNKVFGLLTLKERINPDEILLSIDLTNLKRLGLIEIGGERIAIPASAVSFKATIMERVIFTDFGREFMRACLAPKASLSN